MARLLVAGLAVVLFGLASVSPASGATTRDYVSSFGAFSGTNPDGVSVDQASGDVYAIDSDNGSVHRFTAAGVAKDFTAGADAGTNTLTGFAFGPAGASQVAIDSSGGPTDGDVYVTNTFNSTIEIYAQSGLHLGTLNGSGNANGGFLPCGVAVDQSDGKLYVADAGGVAVWRYTPSAGTITEGTDNSGGITPPNAPCNLAAASGRVYAVSSLGGGPAVRYSDTSFALGTPPSPAGTQIEAAATAIAAVGSNVYVDKGSQIDVYDTGDDLLYSFGAPGDFANSTGVAVAAGANAYVADAAGNQIDIYTPEPPTATTTAASTIHHTDAILNGHLDPGDDPTITDCHFDYGTDTTYAGGTVPCTQGNNFNAPANVSALLNNLTPGNTYHYRLSITGATSGTIDGDDHTVTVPPFTTETTEIAAFGPDGTPATTFSQHNLNALAFNQSDRQLYAVDQGAGIYGFDASAPPAFSPLPAFAPLTTPPAPALAFLAVDNTALASAGNLYLSDLRVDNDNSSGAVFGFDATGAALGGNFPVDPAVSPGAPAGSPKSVCGDAVDSTGSIWVANGSATNRILRYSATGTFQSSVDVSAQFPTSAGSVGPCLVALDSHDNLYVAENQGATWRYTAASGYADATQIDSGVAYGIAVDPSTDDLYISHQDNPRSYISQYDAAGDLVATVASTGGARFYGVSVDATSHDIYVVDDVAGQVRVFRPHFSKPPTITPGDPTAVTDTSATLNAKVDPEGFEVTDCRFEYGVETDPGDPSHVDQSGNPLPIPPSFTYTDSAPCTPTPGSGSGDVAVHGDISGLTGGSRYHFRIVASNAEAEGTATGSDQSFTTSGPAISATRATDITESAATLRAQVNPRGHSTTYQIQYGTNTSYGHTAPASPAAVGSGTRDVAVAEHISGLDPSTTYHFRVVAIGSDGSTTGPDATFTTHAAPPDFNGDNCANGEFRHGPSAQLPDCRAFEQASPVDKGGNSVVGAPGFNQAASDGHAAVFGSYGNLRTSGGSSNTPAYVTSRRESGWSYDGALPATDPGFVAIEIGRDPNLRVSLSGVDSKAGKSLFATDLASFSRQPLPGIPHFTNALGTDPQFASDTGHFTFESQDVLITGAVQGTQNLYDYDDGALTLAGMVPAFPDTSCSGDACVAAAAGSFAGSYDTGDSGDLSRGVGYKQNTISADGSRVFFTEGGTGRLYERVNGTSTVQISAPQGGNDPNGHKPASFLAATPDGATVYFSSCEKLTADSTAVSTADENCLTPDQGADLYAYDTQSGDLTDLTVDSNASDPQRAGVQGILGASPDGAYVYFAANGVLAPGAAPGNCDTTHSDPRGSCSVYLRHDGATRFVARLRAEASTADDPAIPSTDKSDFLNWMPRAGAISNTPPASQRTSRVASDGTLLLSSNRRLTGYDNLGPCSPNSLTGPCAELYRFDPDADNGSGSLRCVSCDPTGAAPLGSGRLAGDPSSTAGVFLRLGAAQGLLTRNLSADGNRIFFETPDPLVAQDVNGASACPRVGGLPGASRRCTDVYEWEADGSGSCRSSGPAFSESAGGCLYLLSTGTSEHPAFFDDASASGEDVFLFTHSPLVPQDTDDLADLYDVRVGGGLASQHRVPSTPCSGDRCQGPPSAPAVLPVAGSVTFTGPGNAPGRPGVPATPKPKVSSRTVRGSRGVLSVKVPSRGRLTVSGTGLRRASAAARKAGTYKLKVVLSAKARRAWKKAHVLRVKAKVIFAPRTGPPATATVKLTFRTAKNTKKGR